MTFENVRHCGTFAMSCPRAEQGAGAEGQHRTAPDPRSWAQRLLTSEGTGRQPGHKSGWPCRRGTAFRAHGVCWREPGTCVASSRPHGVSGTQSGRETTQRLFAQPHCGGTGRQGLRGYALGGASYERTNHWPSSAVCGSGFAQAIQEPEVCRASVCQGWLLLGCTCCWLP